MRALPTRAARGFMETLYNVEASYYGAKIRAYLQYKRLPFTEVLGDRQVYAREILPRVGWAVLPVIVTHQDKTLQDTSDMIDYYEAWHPKKSVLPTAVSGRALSFWLEFIGDEWLKLPALHYRWNYNYDFAVREMGRNNDPSSTVDEQVRIGKKIARTFQEWCPIHGITERTGAAIEFEYLEFLSLFEKHLATSSYLCGDLPSLGDFSFFGPLYAHLYRDPASGDIMRRHAPLVCQWVTRMRDGGVTAVNGPEAWVDFDNISATLVNLVAHLSRDLVPVIIKEIEAFQMWLQNNNDRIMPRYFGEADFVLGSKRAHVVTEKRSLTTYGQWMMQRVLNVFSNADEEQRAKTTALFSRFGAAGVLDIKTPIKVSKSNFKLVRAI